MKRIEGKRARNVARTNRYLNARLRTIGLDTDALDGQVRERRAQEEKESVSICIGRSSTSLKRQSKIGGVNAGSRQTLRIHVRYT